MSFWTGWETPLTLGSSNAMKELLFLIPLLVGLAIFVGGGRWQASKGPAMNRPAFGVRAIVASFLWQLANAILIVYQRKFYLGLNVVTVIIFFVGLAFLV